jgi:signal transduction histidine kinase
MDVGAAINDGVGEISVPDTGVRIAVEDQDMVFEEFRQLEAATKKESGGTLLRLAISRAALWRDLG